MIGKCVLPSCGLLYFLMVSFEAQSFSVFLLVLLVMIYTYILRVL